MTDVDEYHRELLSLILNELQKSSQIDLHEHSLISCKCEVRLPFML